MIVECVKCKTAKNLDIQWTKTETLGKSRWQKDEELQKKNKQAKGLKTNRDNIV